MLQSQQHNLYLITIKPCPDDGRSKRVWITDAGRNLREQTIVDVGPELVNLLADISEQQIQAMIEKLTDIRQQLDANRNN